MVTSAKIREAHLVLLAALLAVFVMSCSDDGTRPKVNKSDGYLDLSEPSHVLVNLEKAMNEMSAAHYVELIDPEEYMFVFSSGDVEGHANLWGYRQEAECAATLLGGQGSNPVLSIDLELVEPVGDPWVEISPGYMKTTVAYNFVIKTRNDILYVTSGTSTAELTVRKSTVDGKDVWRLVKWRDLPGLSQSSAAPGGGTEESSWGRVKTLYGPTSTPYQDLTERWHVLYNLELAMNAMSSTRYIELLDPNDFVFFLDPNDIPPGYPAQWDYTEEVSSATHLLDKTGTIQSIDLDLVGVENLYWTEVLDNPAWWDVTVQYDYNVKAQYVTYITSGTPSAELIVRKDGDGKWRLIRWWDKAGTFSAIAAIPSAVEPTTWTKLKFLYM